MVASRPAPDAVTKIKQEEINTNGSRVLFVPQTPVPSRVVPMPCKYIYNPETVGFFIFIFIFRPKAVDCRWFAVYVVYLIRVTPSISGRRGISDATTRSIVPGQLAEEQDSGFVGWEGACLLLGNIFFRGIILCLVFLWFLFLLFFNFDC